MNGREGARGAQGSREGGDLRRRKTYVHGNVPGHVDVGFVFIHPHFGSPQGIALSVVIYVIVVGLLGALNVSHSGTWQDFHTPSTLPHLDSSRKESPCFNQMWIYTGMSLSSLFSIHINIMGINIRL